ncbi:unnamed protein product [Nippostrongylus brasiliensis]|uniref:Secreted protein n=1 Tax=Nippostrongylus brasiliensis TaxID=27835 RepID=A0A0N4YTJ6_NIPBR|nr:unnamed protein product [Nippostrongylus brasiliensis]
MIFVKSLWSTLNKVIGVVVAKIISVTFFMQDDCTRIPPLIRDSFLPKVGCHVCRKKGVQSMVSCTEKIGGDLVWPWSRATLHTPNRDSHLRL